MLGDTHRQEVLDANGFLFLIEDGPRVWYWLSFVPAEDSQQYQPTLAAILASITIGGSPLEIEEDAAPSSPQESRPAHELSPSEIAKISLKSVVLLATQDSRGRALKLGSGFFVRDGVIATNFHVIDGAQLASASVVGDSQLFRVLGTVAIDKQRDLALLAVDGAKAPPLQLDDPASPVSVGDTVYVAGSPEGLEGTFSQGIVSGVRQQEGSTFIQITAPISPGSSGGPVLNQKCRVIGVAVAAFKEGQNLNFAVPAIQLSELLLKVGPVTPLAGAPKDSAISSKAAKNK
jgi:S1-C subfamily serine protease